jgi:hypothetical protein
MKKMRADSWTLKFEKNLYNKFERGYMVKFAFVFKNSPG